MLENQEEMVTQASSLSKYMKRSSFSLNPIHLPTKMLLAREKDDLYKLKKKKYTSSIIEIIRRAALSISAFSFTFIGICFGIDISRTKSKEKIKMLLSAFAALLILISFTAAKACKYHSVAACLLYLIPQPLILLLATIALRKISRGLE